MCDPSIEQCESGDALLRPAVWDLVMLALNYFINIFIVYFSFILAKDLEHEVIKSGKKRGCDEIIVESVLVIWDWMILASLVIWIPPCTTLTIYMIFGSSFVLFRWTDDLGIWFIT